MYQRIFSICAILSLLLLTVFTLGRSTQGLAATSIQGLHVSGNQILNGNNQQIRLLGVNHAGGEYMCIQGRGIWDGPVDAASVQVMSTWYMNAVRIPLNEDCWLGINGVAASMGGAVYQQAVVDYVNTLNANGMIAILDLHWGAPGTTPADKQTPMPDLDHTPAFWTGVANTFKTNSSVIFDLFNEPYPDSNSDTTAGWTCWRDGGTCAGVAYPVAGMQSLINTVRATGATNIIMLGGLQYSNAFSQWLTYKPTDPAGNLVASWHSYNFNLCSNVVCWNEKILPVLQQVPVIAGEIGENDCAHGYIDSLMAWLDANNTSYLGWTWNNWGAASCATGPILIADDNGTPTAFGQGLKDHLAALKALWTATPTNTWTPGGPTATASKTFTPTPTITPTFTPVLNGGLKAQIVNNGLDNTQETDFGVKITNTGSSAVTGVSFRLYFDADFGLAGSSYVLDRYNEYLNGGAAGTATITGPTLVSGSTYYYNFAFGGTSIPAAGVWELTGRIRLSDWAAHNLTANDWYHTGGLSTTYADTLYVPAYLSGTLAWGLTPAGSGGGGGPTFTPTRTPTQTVPPVITNTPTITATLTRTNTPGITSTPTRTFTPLAITLTPTRTNTPLAITNTPTPTVSGGTCSPVTSTITAPFTFDGAGTFCWQSSNLGTYINSWNTTSVTINGVNATNIYIASGSYPAKIGGFWYISYNSTVAWGHFEAK